MDDAEREVWDRAVDRAEDVGSAESVSIPSDVVIAVAAELSMADKGASLALCATLGLVAGIFVGFIAGMLTFAFGGGR